MEWLKPEEVVEKIEPASNISNLYRKDRVTTLKDKHYIEPLGRLL